MAPRPKKLKLRNSLIHGYGIFADEPISAGEMIIEYVGDVISQSTADIREAYKDSIGIRESYYFRLDDDTIVDASIIGNLSRFINHHCNPNCYTKIINERFGRKIYIYSMRPIAVNEEITYNYFFAADDEHIPCHCGAANCHGTLN